MTKDELNLLIKTLHKISFFSGFSNADIDMLIEKFHKCVFPKGKIIIRENEQGEGFFVIYKGKVEVTRRKSLMKRKHLAILSSGGYFGEVSLISNEPTMATVKAIEYTEAFVLSRFEFQQILRQNPSLAERIKSIAESRKFKSKF